MTKTIQLVHCSWDTVDEFSLRIPQDRIEGSGYCEDMETPRICVARNITDALRAMPGSGRCIKAMRKLGLPVMLHAYHFMAEGKDIYVPTTSQVPDAAYTGELWLVKMPEKKPIRTDYLITGELIQPVTDQNGKPFDRFIRADITQTGYQSNYENFVRRLREMKPETKIPDGKYWKNVISFRKLMLNMDGKLLGMILAANEGGNKNETKIQQ